MWTVDEIIRAVKGEPLNIKERVFSDISTDTRTIKKGELFIPLKGKNYDGHDFIETACTISGIGCLCEKSKAHKIAHLKETIIIVEDTLNALADLAAYRRRILKGEFIAITGSNGKTTTKEILVDILKKAFTVHFNEKNFNNIIGVSKSILSIKESCSFYVFELGTNAPGEIKALAGIVQPDISVITNINPSHLEGLKDIQGVLKEKLDLYYNTKKGGIIFINADDPYITSSSFFSNDQVIKDYAIEKDASYKLIIDEDYGWEGYSITFKFPEISFNAKTKLLGKHNLYNILCSSAIASSVGIGRSSIKESIEDFKPYDKRFLPIKSKNGYLIIDDTYNANPASMEWAIKTVNELPSRGKRIAIIGDMKELGDKEEFYHRQIGRILKESSFKKILLYGDAVKYILDEIGDERAEVFSDKNCLIDFAKKIIRMDDVVLVKGSRLLKMDEIVKGLD
ncbi:MAG TPA: UDP-N-acetylmuramoyl-tripeptide--D-alanyl-D-alanine ligase [Syntrophorhabdaceae bacterium]|nr:UDP-N-acetylmuramoyl-tripeptide--D-alanyl-D-alanine ligase [Syntrophorhabdaceae bacterium]